MVEFNTKIFDPQNYINYYYPDLSLKNSNKSIKNENNYILKFYAKNVLTAIKKISGSKRLLEVGGGPTIHQFISLSTEVDSIFFSDISKKNISYIKKWQKTRKPSWDSYINKSICFEKSRKPRKNEIESRIYVIKRKLKKFYTYDVIKNFWGKNKPKIQLFDIVSSNFCIESITPSLKTWFTSLENLTNLVCPGGYLIITSLKNAQGYKVGKNKFPAVKVTEKALKDALTKLGFESKIYTKTFINQYYSGIIFVIARKNIN